MSATDNKKNTQDVQFAVTTAEAYDELDYRLMATFPASDAKRPKATVHRTNSGIFATKKRPRAEE